VESVEGTGLVVDWHADDPKRATSSRDETTPP